MRIKINFKCNVNLPINNQHIINSYIHKCLGADNEYHDKTSNYSISMLCGGKRVNDELAFTKNCYIIVSSPNAEFINKIIMGLFSVTIKELTFLNIEHIKECFYNGWNHFATLSPILIKEWIEYRKHRFVTLNDTDFDVKFKDYLIKVIKKIRPNYDLSDFDVVIPSNPSHKVKKILIKNVINPCNVFHFSVNCNKEIAELLYDVGIGQSRGSGFGTIYKTESKNIHYNW